MNILKFAHKKCTHMSLAESITSTTKWLAVGAKALEKISKLIPEVTLLVEKGLLTCDFNTTPLQVFQSLKTQYLPKIVYFL